MTRNPAPAKVPPLSSTTPILIRAGHLVDADSTDLTPGAILLAPQGDLYHILAVGEPAAVAAHPSAQAARTVDRMDSVVFPGLVNAHTHLDLTHIGPTQPAGTFLDFVSLVRSRRATDPDSLRASVRAGIEASLRGGVVAVGDIAGALAGGHSAIPFEELALSPLWGTSYLEFFAFGPASTERLKAVLAAWQRLSATTHRRCRVGLQPHAPYSVDLDGYRFAIDLALRHAIPLMTHVAETPQERQFVAEASGPFRTFLESLKLWPVNPGPLGAGRSPLSHVLSLPGSEKLTLVHLNDLSDNDLDLLTPAHRVVYCPRSSAYFGAPASLGNHRYRELLARGVTVALGTDSLVNLSDQLGRVPRISTWDDMCLLARRDRLEPRTLLAMATTAGAQVLDLPGHLFRLSRGNYLINLAAAHCRSGPSLQSALNDQANPELLCPVVHPVPNQRA